MQCLDVGRVLEETSLARSRNEVTSTLSGGAKHLLNLALELLSDRRILFLDEPACGLDAEASLNLMTVLKRLSLNVSYRCLPGIYIYECRYSSFAKTIIIFFFLCEKCEERFELLTCVRAL